MAGLTGHFHLWPGLPAGRFCPALLLE
jgi:hypothetical protein